MKNFKFALVRNFTGMFFVVFLVMYLLFNVLTNNFISAEARRELRDGMTDIFSMTHAAAAEFVRAPVLERWQTELVFDTDFVFDEVSETWQTETVHNAGLVFNEDLGLWQTDELRRTDFVFDEDSGLWRIPTAIPDTNVTFSETTIIEGITDEGGEITLVADIPMYVTVFRDARPLHRLLMNVDSIVVSENNELLSPSLHMATVDAAVEVLFLANYFVSNRDAFENQQMVRVASSSNTYYMMAVESSLSDDMSLSLLLHTDVSSAISFMNSINLVFGVLLLSTAIIAVLISFFMSAKVQKSMLRLCNYAEVIGHGKFDAQVGNFEYREFSNLAQSMNSMSNMLQAYENNQKQFFQNVSHEMRTPLMSIQGYAEGILADVLDKEEATKIIITESERMTGLVSRLLYVSRMDSGLDSLDITTVNVRFLLYDCAERIKILAEKDNKKITFDFPKDYSDDSRNDSPDSFSNTSTDTYVDIEIKSDEGKLHTIIDNILQNCIRHAKTKITLGYHATNENVIITVSDDGEGISKNDLPHIFERFYMGENGNSGLGLSICKDIVKRLNGDIKAENGNGAKFVITLPTRASFA